MSSNIITLRTKVKAIYEKIASKYQIPLSALINKILFEWLIEHKDKEADFLAEEIQKLKEQKARDNTRRALKRLNFLVNVEQRLSHILNTSKHIDTNLFIETIKIWSEEAEALGYDKISFYYFVVDFLKRKYNIEEVNL